MINMYQKYFMVNAKSWMVQANSKSLEPNHFMQKKKKKNPEAIYRPVNITYNIFFKCRLYINTFNVFLWIVNLQDVGTQLFFNQRGPSTWYSWL